MPSLFQKITIQQKGGHAIRLGFINHKTTLLKYSRFGYFHNAI